MSYSNIPTREQLQEITRKAKINQQHENIETSERRYKVFKQGVISTLYELPKIANQTKESSHTSQQYRSELYCSELKQYISRFNMESTTTITLEYSGNDKQCAVKYVWN